MKNRSRSGKYGKYGSVAALVAKCCSLVWQVSVKTLKCRNRGLRVLPAGFSYAVPSLGIKELLVSTFVGFCVLKG